MDQTRTPAEREPDYRFTLANERTFLAWIRPSLALVAGGVSVIRLLPGLGPAWSRLPLGLLLVGIDRGEDNDGDGSDDRWSPGAGRPENDQKWWS